MTSLSSIPFPCCFETDLAFSRLVLKDDVSRLVLKDDVVIVAFAPQDVCDFVLSNTDFNGHLFLKIRIVTLKGSMRIGVIDRTRSACGLSLSLFSL